MTNTRPIGSDSSAGHVTETAGHVPEFGGHDAETGGHFGLKYAESGGARSSARKPGRFKLRLRCIPRGLPVAEWQGHPRAYLRGLMERIGRGTQKIIQSSVDLGLRQPQSEDRETGVTLTLWGPGSAPEEQASLNARRQALLAAMKQEERIRPAEYRERFAAEVSERQARRDLMAMEELGLLRVEGAGAATAYVRTNRT